MNMLSRRRHRGIALVWTVLFFFVLLGLVGLALDTARVYLVAHELQTAADASALAGALYVRTDVDLSRTSASNVANANTAEGIRVSLPTNASNDPAGSIVIGRYDRVDGSFTPTLIAPNAVKVVASRTDSVNGAVPLIFGPMFGTNYAGVERKAIAMIGGGTGAGLIALNSSRKSALGINGTVTLEVDGGTIVVNSGDSSAMVSSGSPTINAPRINAVGGVNLSSNTSYNGQTTTGADSVPDPLRYLTAPDSSSMTNYGGVSVSGNSSTTVNLQPGYYPNGITMTNNQGNLNLAPGIYVVDGPGLKVTGGNMQANGVMFYVKGTGVVDLSGNGVMQLTPIDYSKYSYPASYAQYEGVAIFQDSASNTQQTVSKLVGTNNMLLDGALYFRNNEIDISGTSAGFGSQLIADTINISGNGTVRINYQGRSPAPGNGVFLVQ